MHVYYCIQNITFNTCKERQQGKFYLVLQVLGLMDYYNAYWNPISKFILIAHHEFQQDSVLLVLEKKGVILTVKEF